MMNSMRFMGRFLREDQINLAPVFLRRGAFAGPVRRVIQLVGNLGRPEAAVVTIEEIALHWRAQARRAARGIRFPSRRKNERAAQWNVRSLPGGRPLLQGDYVAVFFEVSGKVGNDA